MGFLINEDEGKFLLLPILYLFSTLESGKKEDVKSGALTSQVKWPRLWL